MTFEKIRRSLEIPGGTRAAGSFLLPAVTHPEGSVSEPRRIDTPIRQVVAPLYTRARRIAQACAAAYPF